MATRPAPLARRLVPIGVFLAVFTFVMVLLFSMNTRALRRRRPHLADSLNLSDFDFRGVAQDNTQLVTYIREIHLQPPSTQGYHLQHAERSDFSQHGQSRLVAKILNGKRNGVFVEAGAYNGEEHSNTLQLERELGWTGLLIEPDPWSYYSLRKRNRKSYSINACLSTTQHPKEVTFRQDHKVGSIVASKDRAPGMYTRVKCFPLFSMLLALNRTSIDYLSLDVKGAELQILKTIPFDLMTVAVMTVEFRHLMEDTAELIMFLAGRGFKFVQELGSDYVFLHHRQQKN